MNVPLFPDMRPLAIEDKALFDRVFKQEAPQISEFTFTNLFAWRQAYRFQVSFLEDCLLVISLKNKECLHVFDPIGDLKAKKKAIEKAFLLGPELIFVRLPETTGHLFEGRAQEDRNNFDYVYRTQDLVELKGKDFDAKRNFIKRFKESVPFEYKKLTRANVEACLDFEEEWCLVKDCQRTEGLSAEREAMRQMLLYFDALGLTGAMLEINRKIEAVTLGEALNPETFVVHIEKANGSYIGIYQAINQLFCAREASGFTYINREQDLGVAGLRQAKESYHPHHMVKKYTLAKNAK